jgi:hypothetical protein
MSDASVISPSFTVTRVLTSERKRNSFGGAGGGAAVRTAHIIVDDCPGTSVASITVCPLLEVREVINPCFSVTSVCSPGMVRLSRTAPAAGVGKLNRARGLDRA